jgi:quinol monooxygenase YgiN
MKVGLLVRTEAKPEYADRIEKMLRGAQDLADKEQETVAWFAFRKDVTTFGVFDTFNDEQERQAHLRGPIAAALGEVALTMLSSALVMAPVHGHRLRTRTGNHRPYPKASDVTGRELLLG